MAVRHLFPQNTGVLSGLWSSGVLEMGCWKLWKGGLGGGGDGGLENGR